MVAMAPGSRRQWWIFLAVLVLVGLGCVDRGKALMTTITHQECVYEEVDYEGDTVSGSFVVIDHGLAWADEPGVELVVRSAVLPRCLLYIFTCVHLSVCVREMDALRAPEIAGI